MRTYIHHSVRSLCGRRHGPAGAFLRSVLSPLKVGRSCLPNQAHLVGPWRLLERRWQQVRRAVDDAVGCQTAFDAALCVGAVLFGDLGVGLAHIGGVLALLGVVADGHSHADLVLLVSSLVNTGVWGTYQRLQGPVGVIHEVIIKAHRARLKEDKQRATTKLEVAQLFCALDCLTLLTRDDRASHHHGADTNDHYAAMGDRVDRHDDAHVLAVDIERRADRHGVHGVVLTLDGLGGSHHAVHGDMEAMVVLRRQAEDAQGAVGVPLHVFGIGVPKESLDGEFAALDPDLRGGVHLVEDDGSAVGGGDDDARVVGSGAGARVGLKFAVEELVEVLEVFNWVEHFGHV